MRDGLEAFATAIAAVKRDERRTTSSGDDDKRICEPLARATPARWKKARRNAPLDVIGTDGVLDLHAGDADVAIRYARTLPTDGLAKEFLSDTFWPVCSPELAPGLKRAAGLRGHVLVHCWWSPSDLEAPTWQRWLAAARGKWRDVPEFKEMDHLSFREELHAIEAVVAGQGIGIFSDVLVARELAAGTLVNLSICACRDIGSTWFERGSSAREDHPGLRDVAAVGPLTAFTVR